jgi:signal transduction histidine kinase
VPALTITQSGAAGNPTGEEIANLASYLQRTREQEREALARELHDELGAILTAARLDLAWLAAQPCNQEPAIASRLQALQRVLKDGIELKRRIIEDLHPTILTHLGLPAALEHLAAELRKRFDGRVDVEIDPSVTVSPEAGLALYRITQESLTNAMKYSGASRLRITLGRAGRQVALRVEDDGEGFDSSRVGPTRHGLIGMHQRMVAVRGLLEIETGPGQGTAVIAKVPAMRRDVAKQAARTAGAANDTKQQGRSRSRARALQLERAQPLQP